MTNIQAMISQYTKIGYSELLAESKVCQDIILKAISKSVFSKNVTIKGGVVMQSITNDVRRATRDIDFDFIKYPINHESIRDFFEKLNCLDGITIRIVGDIEELSEQEYRGKRAWVIVKDNTGNSIKTKVDIGVHKNIQIEQQEYCFSIYHDEEKISLFANTKEQIFTEKLRALLKFGIFSGRLKDVFDMYYLSNDISLSKLNICIKTYILEDETMLENDIDDILLRLSKIFHNPFFLKNIKKDTKSNWNDVDPKEAFDAITKCINRLKQ